MLKKTVESFSDEDLKRLLGHALHQHGRSELCGLTPEMLFALLARLEAAEAYIEYPAIGFPGYEASIHEELFQKWRKAAGKEGR
jgi:hypothetical protein